MKTSIGLMALCVLVLGCATAHAQRFIHRAHRVPNVFRHGGYCAWAASETAALHAGCRQARGLTASVVGRRFSLNGQPIGPAYLNEVGGYLRARGVPVHHCHGRGCRPIIISGTRRGLPVVVGLQLSARHAHCVVVVNYTRNTVRYYDPNNITRMHTMRRPTFNGMLHSAMIVGAWR